MTPFELFASHAALSRKRRSLARKEEWARTLEDQIQYGRWALTKLNGEIDQLRAELFALENPIDILRRAGV